MDLGASDYQAQITDDLSLNSTRAAQVATVWALYADKALLLGGGPRLQFLYTERHFLRKLLGDWAQARDYEEGVTQYHDDQITKHYQAMLKDVEAEIDLIETRAAANEAPQAGQIAATTPHPRPAYGIPNPNSVRYKGDPIRRTSWIW